jgi:hypothetical protein
MESGLLRQISVMPGRVPGIHVFGTTSKEDVDGRDKPGHDEKATHSQYVRQRLRMLTAFQSDF